MFVSLSNAAEDDILTADQIAMKYGMTIPGPQSLVTLITFPSQAKFSPFTNSWSNVSQK